MNPFLLKLAKWILLSTTKNTDQQNPCFSKHPPGRSHQFMAPIGFGECDAESISGKPDSLFEGIMVREGAPKEEHWN